MPELWDGPGVRIAAERCGRDTGTGWREVANASDRYERCLVPSAVLSQPPAGPSCPSAGM